VPNHARQDPLPAFNFLVQLIESSGANRSVAGFSECSGVEATLEVEEYKEGGANGRMHKFRSRFNFANIVLKRGIALDETLREWHLSLLNGSSERRDGLIVLLNEQREPVLAWRFERGLPVKYSGPSLNATQSQAAIETLEISHERLEPFGLGRS
jgi:phage tail-like protein